MPLPTHLLTLGMSFLHSLTWIFLHFHNICKIMESSSYILSVILIHWLTHWNEKLSCASRTHFTQLDSTVLWYLQSPPIVTVQSYSQSPPIVTVQSYSQSHPIVTVQSYSQSTPIVTATANRRTHTESKRTVHLWEIPGRRSFSECYCGEELAGSGLAGVEMLLESDGGGGSSSFPGTE